MSYLLRIRFISILLVFFCLHPRFFHFYCKLHRIIVTCFIGYRKVDNLKTFTSSTPCYLCFVYYICVCYTCNTLSVVPSRSTMLMPVLFALSTFASFASISVIYCKSQPSVLILSKKLINLALSLS